LIDIVAEKRGQAGWLAPLNFLNRAHLPRLTTKRMAGILPTHQATIYQPGWFSPSVNQIIGSNAENSIRAYIHS
jgi:hypothetical protein